MKAELNKKTVRTVYGEKVARVELDIPYDELKDAENEEQDILKWLDANVGTDVSFQIGPFEDEQQHELDSSVVKELRTE